MHTHEGLPPLKTATTVAAHLGIDLEQHRSRLLRNRCLVGTDLVVGFEEAHGAAAVEVGGASPEHVFLLLELPELLEALSPRHTRDAIAELHRLRRSAGQRRRVAAVPDPVGEPEQVFAEAARVIDAVTGALAAAVLPARNAVSALQPAR